MGEEGESKQAQTRRKIQSGLFQGLQCDLSWWSTDAVRLEATVTPCELHRGLHV